MEEVLEELEGLHVEDPDPVFKPGSPLVVLTGSKTIAMLVSSNKGSPLVVLTGSKTNCHACIIKQKGGDEAGDMVKWTIILDSAANNGDGLETWLLQKNLRLLLPTKCNSTI